MNTLIERCTPDIVRDCQTDLDRASYSVVLRLKSAENLTETEALATMDRLAAELADQH